MGEFLKKKGLLIESLLLSLCLSGCYKGHLYVQQEWVDKSSLASSWVKTPDYRADRPAEGQRLLMSWDFPKSTFDKKLTLIARVRLWDNTEEVLAYPIKRKRGSTDYFFPNGGEGKSRKILTYLVQVVAENGEVVEAWKHQFWTELIEIDREGSSFLEEESRSDAEEINSSVSFQPKQASVIETPYCRYSFSDCLPS